MLGGDGLFILHSNDCKQDALCFSPNPAQIFSKPKLIYWKKTASNCPIPELIPLLTQHQYLYLSKLSTSFLKKLLLFCEWHFLVDAIVPHVGRVQRRLVVHVLRHHRHPVGQALHGGALIVVMIMVIIIRIRMIMIMRSHLSAATGARSCRTRSSCRWLRLARPGESRLLGRGDYY